VAQLGSIATQTSASSSGASAASAQQNEPLVFSRCMRSHGVRKFPDPDSSGAIPKVALQQLAVSSSQFQAAQTACSDLLPSANQPGPSTQARLRQAWSDSVKFASCMRSHGVSKWPDPTADPVHPERPNFGLQPVGVDQNSPQITSKIRECEPLLHGWSPYVHSGAGRTHLAGS
jgi:hypothetical protein